MSSNVVRFALLSVAMSLLYTLVGENTAVMLVRL